jgi:hypothetical protein
MAKKYLPELTVVTFRDVNTGKLSYTLVAGGVNVLGQFKTESAARAKAKRLISGARRELAFKRRKK